MRVRVAAAAAILSLATGARATDEVAGNLIRFNDNGGWSWYQDERAIVAGNQLLVSSSANASGVGGAARSGNVEVTAFDLNTRRVAAPVNLQTIQPDDHNAAALLVRPDGRILAAYGNHNADNLTRYRVSANPGDPTAWGPAQTYVNAAAATYNNLFYLPAENKTYDFTRTEGFDPNFLVSADQGSTWTYGGHLLTEPANGPGQRPYVKYASNNADRIYFLSTEGHPRDVNNGVYAGYVKGGQLYAMDGTLVGPPGTTTATAPPVTAFTTVLAPNSNVNGTVRTNAWTTDLAVDAAGNPYALFTSRVDGADTDHRFYYGRWTGTAWSVHELAKAGGYLYAAENDYTGGGSVDPRDPNAVYISTKIDPASQAALAHYEVFKGVTADGGATWAWSAITRDSTVDNLRPIVPAPGAAGGGGGGGDAKALLWMRGTYSTYTNYNLSVVGLVEGPAAADAPAAKATYVDATPANTARASGAATAYATGPAAAQGATDGLWHRRTGFGNGGEVLTAAESATETVPTLVTTATGLTAGRYDVYAYFWSDDDEAWRVRLGLSEAGLSLYEKQSAQHVTLDALTGATAVEGNGGDLLLYRAYLGRTDVDGSGLLKVFVNEGGGAGTSRTWFDGIGYSPVPEPGGAGLGGAAAWGLLARRRRPLARPSGRRDVLGKPGGESRRPAGRRTEI